VRVHLDQFESSIYRHSRSHEAENRLRAELVAWHMTTADRDCFVDEALRDPHVPTTDPVQPAVWTAAQLNGYAARCDIDLHELYMDMDRPGFMDGLIGQRCPRP
jgi:hypothetical protein